MGCPQTFFTAKSYMQSNVASLRKGCSLDEGKACTESKDREELCHMLWFLRRIKGWGGCE